MAIRNPLTGKPHTKPGPDHSWRVIHDLHFFLAKLGIKSARRPRHPYENVDRDEEER